VRIESIQLENVGVHDSYTLTLPERGVTLVTGNNGKGKSSFVEAVALAGWGASLRDAPIWREGQSGIVKLAAVCNGHHLLVERRRTKSGGKSLNFSIDGAQPVKYETPTKAQAALEEMIGTFDSWRRTCVLSSADSAHFSLAGDAERKRLLERLLGLDRLEFAFAAAKADALLLQKELSRADFDKRTAATQCSTAQARVREITDSISALSSEQPKAQAAHLDIDQLHRKLSLATEEQQEARAELGELDARVANAQAELRQAQRRLQNLAADECPTCEQQIPKALRQKLEAGVASAEKRAAKAKEAMVGRQDALARADRDLTAEAAALQKSLANAAAGAEHAKRLKGLKQMLEDQLGKARHDEKTAELELFDAASRQERLQRDYDVKKAVVGVYGLRGVRAHLLDKALSAAEKAANRQLGILGPGMSLELRSTSVLKSGAPVDAIGLNVRLKGAQRAYAALSGGERRRVDVALLLGLAEVAAHSSGHGDSSLFGDEVMDALDEDGRDAAASLISALGQRRNFILISHNEALAKSVKAAQRVAL
jgi:Straboviridae exonuclease subunit 2